MSLKIKTALARLARVALYGAVSAVTTALPTVVFDVVPEEYAFVATPLITAVLVALDKARRYGQDPGELA